MNRHFFVASGAVAVLAAGAPAAALVPRASSREELATRAEASKYAQTSSYADMQELFAALDRRGAPIVRGVLGVSEEGRDIPYVIASRPRVRTVEEARALERAVVLVLANLHGNDVDGKEAILAIVRDLCIATEKTILEDIVLIVVPSLNPDGNERVAAVGREPRAGTRENARGIDLDADFVKLEAPETRALLAFVRMWKPDVFVDLRTSDTSFDDFSVTYAPSLHPAAWYGGVFARDIMLPALHAELRKKFGVETFSAGNFGRERPLAAPAPASDALDYGWFAPDYRPRSATNYMGLRGPVAFAVASCAHDTLERRIYATRAFVEAALAYTSEHDDEITAVATKAARWSGGSVPLRGVYPGKAPSQHAISWETLALSLEAGEPGVPPGFKRTGTFESAVMPIYDRYLGTTEIVQPNAYLIPYEFAALVKPLLDLHGIAHETSVETRKVRVSDFVADRIERSQTPYENHRTLDIAGHWRPETSYVVKFGALLVPAKQQLGPLASVLLEPESADGFFLWNVFEPALRTGSATPVMRLL
ncbi:MAG: hypothetical protein NVSMB19_16030 [Vulcanimicrobiaceae bacterium]